MPAKQGSAEWLELRRDSVGASELPMLLNISSFGGSMDVYLHKTDPTYVRPVSEAEQEQMDWGIVQEEPIAQWWSRRNELKVRHAHVIRYATGHPRVSASIDRQVLGRPWLLEIKVRRSRWGWGEPGTYDIPDDVYAQVQQQMACSPGVEQVIVLASFGGPPVEFIVPRDTEFINGAIEFVDDWWQTYAGPGKPPPPDGSKGYDRYQAHRFRRSTDDAVPATADIEVLMGDLQAIRRNKAQMERDEGVVIQRIKDYMGESGEMYGVGFKVLWRWSKDKTETDWKLVAGVYRRALEAISAAEKEELSFGGKTFIPKEAEPIAHDPETVIGLYTITKKGSRPFLPTFDEGSTDA